MNWALVATVGVKGIDTEVPFSARPLGNHFAVNPDSIQRPGTLAIGRQLKSPAGPR